MDYSRSIDSSLLRMSTVVFSCDVDGMNRGLNLDDCGMPPCKGTEILYHPVYYSLSNHLSWVGQPITMCTSPYEGGISKHPYVIKQRPKCPRLDWFQKSTSLGTIIFSGDRVYGTESLHAA